MTNMGYIKNNKVIKILIASGNSILVWIKKLTSHNFNKCMINSNNSKMYNNNYNKLKIINKA